MNYFPTYLAIGNAFCNRKSEIKKLLYNIDNNIPSLIISPRRYGKTSLVINTLTQLKHPYSTVDFYKALSKEDIETFVLNGVGKLLGQLETAPKKLLKLANEFFSNMQIKVVLQDVGITLDFDKRTKKAASVLIILEALEKLQKLAVQKKKKVILFLDEFQAVGEVTKDYSIEAVIREAIQKSTNVAYVFSGSNRHLMEQMFYDKKRPFYKLCDLITIDRISVENYKDYIKKAALRTWNKNLDSKLVDAIFAITERHAYYVNKLCSLLWQNDFPKNVNIIYDIWRKFVLENKSFIEREMELLSINQRKILILLANREAVREPYGKDFAISLGLSLSSIAVALSDLIAKDYVYMTQEKEYRILDPLIKSVLSD